MKKYDVVLNLLPAESGLTRTMLAGMTDVLKGEEFYPIEIEADHQRCSGIGFISAGAAEKLDYDYAELNSYMGGVLDDHDGVAEYEFEGLSLLVRC